MFLGPSDVHGAAQRASISGQSASRMQVSQRAATAAGCAVEGGSDA